MFPVVQSFEYLVFSKFKLEITFDSISYKCSQINLQCFHCVRQARKSGTLYFNFHLYSSHHLDICFFEPTDRSTSLYKCEKWVPSRQSEVLKDKIKRASVQDLTNYGKLLYKIYKSLDTIKNKHKKLDLNEIVDSLQNKIIPFEYFGSRKNRHFFFKLVKRITKQTYKECIHVTELYEPFDCSKIQWLQTIEKERQPEILKQTNIHMIQTVVKPLVKHYYVFETSLRSRSVINIPRSEYYQTRQKYESQLVKNGYMERTEIIMPSHNRGYLKFNQKNDGTEFRPIVILDKKHKTNAVVNSLKIKLKLLIQKMVEHRDGLNFYEKWTNFCNQKREKKLYAIKLDVQDAFGNTNMDDVKSIINSDNVILTEIDKKHLFKYMSSQYVNRGKRFYKWTHGVLQGDKLSNILAEIYLVSIENKHLSSFWKSSCLYHRAVDDILFVSKTTSALFDFENVASQVLILNEKKSVKYFDIEDDPNIVYIGHSFNMKTRETSYNYQFRSSGIQFNVWNTYNQIPKDDAFQFLMKHMTFHSVNYAFWKLHLGAVNSREKIVENIFKGMCFVAFKLDYQIKSIKYAFTNSQPLAETVLYVVANLLDQFPIIIVSLIKKNNPDKLIEKSLNFRVIKWIGLKAFTVVFRRRNLTYKRVLPVLKNALNKYHVSLKQAQLDIQKKYFEILPEVFKVIKMNYDKKK